MKPKLVKFAKIAFAVLIAWATTLILSTVGQVMFFGISDDLPIQLIAAIPYMICFNPIAYLAPIIIARILIKRLPEKNRGVLFGGIVGGFITVAISFVLGYFLLSENPGGQASNGLFTGSQSGYLETEQVFSSTGQTHSPLARSVIATSDLNELSNDFLVGIGLPTSYYNWEVEEANRSPIAESACGEECVEKNWVSTTIENRVFVITLTVSISRFEGDAEDQARSLVAAFIEQDFEPVTFDWQQNSRFRTYSGCQTTPDNKLHCVLLTKVENLIATYWISSNPVNISEQVIETNIEYLSYVSAFQWKRLSEEGLVTLD